MTVVAVTGLHRGDPPQPGAAVVASLRRRFSDLRVIGLCYDPLESSLYCHDSSRPDAAYLLPYPGSGSVAVLERLDEILKHENISFLIPCLDSEIANFTALRSRLRARGIDCILPTAKSLTARSKENLQALCRRIGIATPRTEAANDPASLAAYADEIGYPVIVKGHFYEARFVNSRDELYDAFDKIFRVWGGPILVQEWMVGEEYDIVGLGDGKGSVISACSIRKMLRTSAGKGFAGVVVADPELDDRVHCIIKALRWNGPFELEFLKVPGKPHALFEMNPRFPAWVEFPAQIGCNLPARLLEEMLHLRPAPLRTCPPGQMFVRHSVDIALDIGDVAQITITGEREAITESMRPQLKVIK
jgi:carbamoyl-phosphate synthase large subunit